MPHLTYLNPDEVLPPLVLHLAQYGTVLVAGRPRMAATCGAQLAGIRCRGRGTCDLRCDRAADNTGLGVLGVEFVKHLEPDRVLGVDVSVDRARSDGRNARAAACLHAVEQRLSNGQRSGTVRGRTGLRADV